MMPTYSIFSLPGRPARLLTLLALLLPLAGWGQVNFTAGSLSYSQDFNALRSSGSGPFVSNGTIPDVYAQRTGTGTAIQADIGSGTGGNLYSYGAAGSTERALGSLGSGNAAAGNFAHGILFRNTTGADITSLNVSYTGEQWRNSGAAAQTLTFWYRVSSSAITSADPQPTGNESNNGVWTAVAALDFTSPMAGGAAGALNGNAAANQAALASTFPVALPDNSYIMLRWNDPDHTGGDHGLAIDDVALTATATPAGPALTATPSALSFTAGTGQAAPTASYALAGSGLAPGASVSIASSDPAVLLSLSGAAPYSQTATATADAAGTLAQTVTVQFTAPATAGTTTATISNTSGSLQAPVAVTGTAVVPVPVVAGLLLLEENFDYPAMTTLTTATPATGWLDAPGTPGTTPRVITSPGNLARDGYPQGVAAVGGNSTQAPLTGGGGAQDIYKQTAPLPASSTALYTAVLVNVSAAQSGDYFLALNTSQTNLYRGRVFVEAVAGGFDFGLSVDGNAGAAVYSGATYAFGTPYLLVLRYENSAATGSTDAVALHVVPAAAALVPTDEPATPTIGPLASTRTDLSSLDAVLLRQAGAGSAPTLTLDNLRVATGWGAAVGRPTYLSAAPTINAGHYYDVTLNTSGDLTPAGAVRVENELTLTSGLVNTSAADLLTLYPGATVSGGNAGSYVNGPVARLTLPGAAPAAVFPLGRDGAYRPATLSTQAQTSTTTYVAELRDTTARTSALAPASGLTRVSDVRYTTITPDAQPTGYTGTLTLAFGPDDYVNDPQDTSFVLARRDAGGDWQNIGRSSATGTANAGQYVSGSLTSGPFTAFSDFALASTAPAGSNGLNTSNPLPVELTGFAARRTAAGAVALAWATASERNSARFEVERSRDGHGFERLGQLPAQGYSARPTAYAYADALAPAGPLYYRLRQLARDGAARYSPVVAVAAAAAPLAAYPNPSTGLLTLSDPALAGQPARLCDLSGRELRRTEVSATGQLSLGGLPAGTYLLRVGQRTLRVARQ